MAKEAEMAGVPELAKLRGIEAATCRGQIRRAEKALKAIDIVRDGRDWKFPKSKLTAVSKALDSVMGEKKPATKKSAKKASKKKAVKKSAKKKTATKKTPAASAEATA